ncbi:hypothetical protein P692DRAFT_20750767 [Suillus brevipes Sb2]|nr:hypothetical protein P692DRAFT_20750767 [Suillus brevipes Sb2]
MALPLKRNQDSPQLGHKHLKHNHSRSQQEDRKTLCTNHEGLKMCGTCTLRSALLPLYLYITRLIINIRHHHMHTWIHRPLSPNAPPSLVNSPLGSRL